MEKIDEFLSKLYGNAQNLMYFYIVLSVIALFFILLIIITLIKSSIESKKEKNKDKNKEIKEDNVTNVEIDVSNTTKVFNNSTISNEEPIINNNIQNEQKSIDRYSFAREDEVYLEKAEDENEQKVESSNNNSTELTQDSFKIEDNKNIDYTIEMPQVKAIDIDDYLLNHEDSKTVEPKKEIQTDFKESVVVSNNELKERLQKLKEQKTEDTVQDDSKDQELEELMKAVGLEDTFIIPKLKDEESILGK